MLADINKIEFFKHGNDYDIYTEFADYPIESFKTEEEAIKFIIGYKSGFSETPDDTILKGMIYRKVIEDDIKSGILLHKINDLNKIIYV